MKMDDLNGEKIYLSHDQIKCELLNMLKWIDDFMHDNNIKYTIMSGTMLGAIRHGGFIPWDDDIDIGLLRSEYNKFILAIKNINSQTNFCFIGAELDNDTKPYIKLLNKKIRIKTDSFVTDEYLWIDIFPFDGVPNKVYQFYFHKFIKKIYGAKNYNGLIKKSKNFLTRFYNLILHFLFIKKDEMNIAKFLVRQAQKVNISRCDYVEDIVWGTKSIPKYLFNEIVEYRFEDLNVKGFKDYDTYLTCIYGDYMKLPPEDQRVNHGIKAWRVTDDEE